MKGEGRAGGEGCGGVGRAGRGVGREGRVTGGIEMNTLQGICW